MTTYNLTQLAHLGRQRTKLRAQLDALVPEIREEILAAHKAGIRQTDIVKASGLTRDAIRVICRDSD